MHAQVAETSETSGTSETARSCAPPNTIRQLCGTTRPPLRRTHPKYATRVHFGPGKSYRQVDVLIGRCDRRRLSVVWNVFPSAWSPSSTCESPRAGVRIYTAPVLFILFNFECEMQQIPGESFRLACTNTHTHTEV